MSANLLGYIVVKPIKGHKIAKHQIGRLEGILNNPTLSDERKVKRCIKLGAGLDYSNDSEELSDADFISNLRAELDLLNETDFDNVDFRDLNMRNAKVGKNKIEILFAGDMSWGDEPDGAGYQFLRSVSRVGIADAWEKQLAKR